MKKSNKLIFMIVCILLISSLTIGLVACKDKDDKEDTTEPVTLDRAQTIELLKEVTLPYDGTKAISKRDYYPASVFNLTMEDGKYKVIASSPDTTDEGGLVYSKEHNSYIQYLYNDEEKTFFYLNDRDVKTYLSQILWEYNALLDVCNQYELFEESKKDYDNLYKSLAIHEVKAVKDNDVYSITLINTSDLVNEIIPCVDTFNITLDANKRLTSCKFTKEVMEGYLPTYAESSLIGSRSYDISYGNTTPSTKHNECTEYVSKNPQTPSISINSKDSSTTFDGTNEEISTTFNTTVTLPIPKSKYFTDADFAGYYYDRAFTSPVVDNKYVTSRISASNAVYAKWNAKGKATIELNGGSFDYPEEKDYLLLTTDILNVDVSKADSSLEGWYYDAAFTQEVSFETRKPITNDTKFFAKWEEEKTYNITVLPNIDLGYKFIAPVIKVVDILYPFQLPTFIADGKLFDYDWRGNIQIYEDKECTKLIPDDHVYTKDTTIYVKLYDGYKVNLKYYDGMKTTVEDPAWKMVNKGTSEDFSEPDAKPLDLYFKAWYLDEACTQKYDASKELTGDLTLYAKYTTIEEINSQD